MSEDPQHLVFDRFSINLTEKTLWCGEQRVHLPRKPFDVLCYLLHRRGELVTREELLQEFWGGTDTYDEAVYRCISSIRKALQDTGEPARCLETRWGEGYCFIAEVSQQEAPASAATPAPQTALKTRQRWWQWPGAVLVTAVAIWAVWSSIQSPPIDDSSIIDSIAVLPVEGRGVDAWLLQGLTDELIHAASGIEGVRVISAASRGAEVEQANLGERLGAKALLSGRLNIGAAQSELQLQLIDSSSGTILWSFREPYDSARSGVLSSPLLASLANRLSARLRMRQEQQQIQSAVWLDYLRARQQWKLRTPQSINSAIETYQRVIAQEPDFANAHAGLAEAYTTAPMYTGADPSMAYGAARKAAETAIRLDPQNARAHAVLGAYYAHFEIDWSQAVSYFARAIEIDPNNALAHQWKADAYCYRLLIDDCRYHMSLALRLEPLSPILAVSQGIPDRFAGNFAAAESILRDVLKRYPDLAPARFQLGLVLDAQSKYEEAIEQWERIYPQYGPALLASSLANAYAALGRHDDARVLHTDLRRLRDEGFVSAIMMAGMTMTYGTEEEALDWLDVAKAEHDDFYSGVAVIHHFFELHDNPRFIAMVAELGVPAERLAEFAAKRASTRMKNEAG